MSGGASGGGGGAGVMVKVLPLKVACHMDSTDSMVTRTVWSHGWYGHMDSITWTVLGTEGGV